MKNHGVIRETIVGGLLFLLPLMVIVVLVGKAYSISLKVSAPIGKLFSVDRFWGVAFADLLAVLVILLICYLAGRVARLSAIRAKVAGLEDTLEATIPGYAFAKTLIGGMANAEEAAGKMTPILVVFDDYKQIAFEIERLSSGNVVVYLPGAPNPWSGTVVYVAADRIEPLDMKPQDAIKNIRVLGRGSEKLAAARP